MRRSECVQCVSLNAVVQQFDGLQWHVSISTTVWPIRAQEDRPSRLHLLSIALTAKESQPSAKLRVKLPLRRHQYHDQLAYTLGVVIASCQCSHELPIIIELISCKLTIAKDWEDKLTGLCSFYLWANASLQTDQVTVGEICLGMNRLE